MDIHVKVGGPAGAGVFSVGEMVGRTFSRKGYHVFIYKDYPSLIKGGHNFMHIRISDFPTSCVLDRTDYLVGLDSLSFSRHSARMKIGLESDGGSISSSMLDGLNTKVKSVLLYGALMKEIGVPKPWAEEMVIEKFGKKKELLNDNLEALSRAYGDSDGSLGQAGEKRMLLTGNEATFLGAVKSGVRFLASYPMTPASSILHLFSKYSDMGLIYKQTEDEIAAINMALGASYAGMKSMVATSGGGFALMAESIGLGALAEIPVVIVESQRVGPSTGMPTYSEQSDLKFVLNASQGDFPRIVVAPGTIAECYEMAQMAVNLSEMLQTPVVLLLDKNLSESHISLSRSDLHDMEPMRRKMWNGESEFLRYRITESGISEMSVPGMKGGEYVATSYEHDESGFTTEDPEMRVKQVRKRARKIREIPPEWIQPRVFGEGDVLVVGFGSVLMTALEAMRIRKFTYLHIPVLSPFPADEVRSIIERFDKHLIVENNHDGHLRGLIREKTGIWLENSFNYYDGRLLYPERLADMVGKVV